MQLVINPNSGGSSGGGLIKTVHLPPLVKLGDNLAIGMSQDSALNNAQGSLYPTALSTTLTSQTAITQVYGTDALSYYPQDDQQYDVAESKLKVGDKFFTAYTKLVSWVYRAFTAGAKIFPTTTATFYNIYKIEWLDATRFAMYYLDQTTVQNLCMIIGKVGTDGNTTFGAVVVVKTYTDVTHTNNGHMGMSVTDTDKVMCIYSNKVSTSYYLKARMAVITDVTIALQSEMADSTNFGTTALGYVQSVSVRRGAGAGAVAVITTVAAGGATMNRVAVLSHDASNAITVGALVALPAASAVYASLFSHITDRLIIAVKETGTTHVTCRYYTIAGTTLTPTGAGAINLSPSTSANHYLPTAQGWLGWCNFGNSILGMVYNFANNQNRIVTVSVLADTLTLVDDGSNAASQLNSTSNQLDTRMITRGDGSAVVFSSINGGSNPIVSHIVTYGNGRANVQNYLEIGHDLPSQYVGGIFPSANKTFFIESNQNYNQTIRYQIGAGDSSIQILDINNNVLGTITETGDGGGITKLKTLNLTNAALFTGDGLQFKIKNNSSQARVIKTVAFYAEVE